MELVLIYTRDFVVIVSSRITELIVKLMFVKKRFVKIIQLVHSYLLVLTVSVHQVLLG